MVLQLILLIDSYMQSNNEAINLSSFLKPVKGRSMGCHPDAQLF